ncbi:Uncharacterised protein [Staphylococcus aureus]|nr:Uncharacterised protein [Staphylococcus aureus]
MAISFPRILASSFSFFSTKSSPKNFTFPFVIFPFSPWNNLVIALVATDLPDPDSPTIASISPSCMQ